MVEIRRGTEMDGRLIDTILKYLHENPDGESMYYLAHRFAVNRFMLGGYLQAYEEVGVLRKVKIGPAVVFKIKDESLLSKKKVR